MLFCGRKLTAQEACSRGLVSQVFWPTTFNQEVMLRVKEMASCNAVVGPNPDIPAGRVFSLIITKWPSLFFLCVCVFVCLFWVFLKKKKGFRRIQMPGEEYPHVSPGGGQWERVPDAEAALVFNQRTGGALQLPAQQVVWEVMGGLPTAGHPNWRKSCFASIHQRRGFAGVLFARMSTLPSWSSFVKQLLVFFFTGPVTVQMIVL